MPIFILIVASWFWNPIAEAAGPIPLCVPGIENHCGFDRPEDVDVIPSTGQAHWVLVAQADPKAPLVFLETRSGVRRIAATSGASRCAGRDSNLEAGGIAIDARGQRIAVIDKRTPQSIAIFALRFDAQGPRISSAGCVEVPPEYAFNDVAIATDGSLYASHMFTRAATAEDARALRARFLAHETTGYAVRWRRVDGWQKLADSDVSFANGIALSQDERWLAISGTFDQALRILDLSGKVAARTVPISLQPDNVSVDGADRFLVAGHTGTPVTGVDPCRPRESMPCGFPFAVAQISAESATTQIIHEDDGARTPGASVAVRVDDRLLLGSAFGDRVSVRRPSISFRHRTVEGGGGVPIEVIETGNPAGTPIVFVHGMSQSHLAWLPQLRSSLARDHRLIAFDLRGHGASGKPWRSADYADSKLWADDVDAVLRALQVERAVFVAWSYGGHALMSYVRHFGTARIAALDFTGTLAGLRTVTRVPGADTDRLLAGSRLRASPSIEDNIEGYRAMASGLSAKPLPQDLEEVAFLTGLMQPSYVRRAMRELPTRNEDLVAKLTVPVLLSMGELDREWPIEECRALAAALPSARLSIYAERGHFPSAEDAERFNAELEELARSNQPN